MVVSGFPPKSYYMRTCNGGQRHWWADRKREMGEGGEEGGVLSINSQMTAK